MFSCDESAKSRSRKTEAQVSHCSSPTVRDGIARCRAHVIGCTESWRVWEFLIHFSRKVGTFREATFLRDTVQGSKSQPGHRQTLSQHRQTPGQTVVKQTSGNEQAHVRLSRLTALPPSLSPLRTPLEVVLLRHPHYLHKVL